MDEDLLTQMGLMLTQLRYARRALEDIERSTARYAGFAFASALQAGPAFGAPPMLDGALRVHVVNINDLQPGTGFGGFLESLLGGVGRFFGGLLGGFVGGTISGFNLVGVITSMLELARRVERILGVLGLPLGEDAEKKKGSEPASTLSEQLKEITNVIKALTGLFTSASNPDKAGEIVKPKTDAGIQWLEIFRTAQALVQDISRVVTGLIILIPTLIGALASIIVHLRDIQKEILSLLQFLMKEIFLLRGVVLFTLWDTIAGAAHLAARVLETLSTALQTIIVSIGGIFTKIFDAGLAILKFLAEGLKNTVNALLTWLVGTIGVVLTGLGNSKIFRVVVYLVQVLPELLPNLLRLLDKPVEPVDKDVLKKAIDGLNADVKWPPEGKTLADMIPKFPELKETLAPATEVAGLGDKVKAAFDGVKTDLKTAFDASIKALNNIGNQLDEVKKDKSFLDALDAREATLRDSSEKLAKTLADAQKQLAERPKTGLETIAKAYEDWLTNNGMKSILDQLATYFKESPNAGAFAPPLPPTTVERPRATVEIKELVIELDPSADIFREPVPRIYQASLEEPAPAPDPAELAHERWARGETAPAGAQLIWGTA